MTCFVSLSEFKERKEEDLLGNWEYVAKKRKRELESYLCFSSILQKLYSQPLNIMVVFLLLKFIEGKNTGLLFDVSLYFVMRVWWSSSKKPKVSPDNCREKLAPNINTIPLSDSKQLTVWQWHFKKCQRKKSSQQACAAAKTSVCTSGLPTMLCWHFCFVPKWPK